MNALPSLTPTVAAPTGAATPTAGPEAEGGFADALQQARQPQTAAEGERRSRPAGTANRAREGRPAESGKAPAREKPDAAGRADAADAAGRADAAEAAEAGTAALALRPARGVPADIAAAETTVSPPLPQWLEAALARPARAAEALPSARPLPEGPGGLVRTREPAATLRQTPAAALGAAPAPGGAAATASAAAAAAADAVAERPAFAAALQQAQAEMPRGPTVTTEPLPALLGSAAAAPGSPASAASARAEVAERSLPTPMHSPEFAPALGAQLNLLVREGVTEARLHLNPAEMGPISVQIQIEGQTARVEMVAEQAQTRQVLEQAMPVLAGALRDSGLTLAGGGVFEQRREPQGESGGRPGGAPGGTTAEGAPAEEPARPTPLPQGMVDLYA